MKQGKAMRTQIRRKMRQAYELLSPRAFSRQSFAQEGEDLVLLRLFAGRRGGFYVDVGSHHPHRFSNTYLLYRMGWHGLCVDPLPGTAAAFRRARPRDIAVEMGVSATPGALMYHMFNEPALNGFDARLSQSRDDMADYRIIDTRSIDTDTLANIMDRYVPADRIAGIDLLSVDVEGLDLAVLQSNDWSRFRPETIVAECLGTDIASLSVDPVAALLGDVGYVPYAKTGQSVIFTRRDR